MDYEKFYHPAMPKSLEYPLLPVSAILKGAARKYGSRAAYLYRDHTISFEQLYSEAKKFANALKRLGIEKGDVVAVMLPTCPQYIIGYYGIVLSGAIYSPINPAMPEEDVRIQLNDCGARMLLTHDHLIPAVNRLAGETNLECVIVTGPTELSDRGIVDVSEYGDHWFSFAEMKNACTDEEIAVSINPKEDLVHIAYTGGTTGKPKGVMITHYNVVSSLIQTAAWSQGVLAKVVDDGIEPVLGMAKETFMQEYPHLPGEAVSLSPAPLFHTSGLFMVVVSTLFMGITSILIDRFDPSSFLETIEKHRVADISGAPALFNYLVHHPDIKERDMSSVRAVGSGSAPITVDLMKQLAIHFPDARVTEGYGLTETTAGSVASIGYRSGLRKLGTVGIPMYDTQAAVSRIGSATIDPLPPGESGEIWLKGPQVMQGYYNNIEETKSALVDGWLNTGDVGFFDEDGFLTIVDRSKDMLIYKGYNVYPRKLEEILYEHPAVMNAVVIGIPSRDAGEIPKAFVVLKSGMDVSEEELMEYVNTKVIHYYKIREMEFIDALPLTAAGKVLKMAFREKEIAKQKVHEKRN